MKPITFFLLSIITATIGLANPFEVPADTIPVVDEEEPQPRIIYYQTDKDDLKNDRRSNKRGQRIKTLAGSMNHSGGFGAISFKTSSFRDEALVMGGVRGGWIINRTLALGAEGYGFIPTTKFRDIEIDNEVVALGGYGGLFLELIFFSNEVVHVTFPVGSGAGWLGYERLNNSSLIGETDFLADEDVFWYVEPGADVEVNIARNFRLVLGVSRRFTQDLELVNTDGQALQKLNVFLTLKIGSF